MVDFNNTKIAFRMDSTSEMRRARCLFGILSCRRLSNILGHLLVWSLKFRLPIGWAIKKTIYQQFAGGATIDEADRCAGRLNDYGVKSVLDYSVEGKSEEVSFNKCFDEVKNCIIFAASRPYIVFAVFKPTGVGNAAVLQKVSIGAALSNNEKSAYASFAARVNGLCKAASEHEVPLLIDAEDYCVQNAIDLIVEQMMEKYNQKNVVVYHTLQMYRTGRLDYLKQLHERAKSNGFKLGIKLVRGAYLEKERMRAHEGGYTSPVNDTKEQTDQMYDEALMYSIENIGEISIFAGTHNQDSIQFLTELVYKYSLPENDPRIWFSQLYGMSNNVSFNLAKEHFNVAKYLPYGKINDVMPYMVRRIEENSAVQGQASHELDLIRQEIERRKDYHKW